MVFDQQAEIGTGRGDAIEGVFQPAGEGGKGIALSFAHNGLALPQPGATGQLHIGRELGNDGVDRPQALPVGGGHEKGFAAGTVKGRQSEIPIAEIVAPAGSEIDMAFLVGMFVERGIRVDDERAAQPALDAGEGAFAKTGQEIGFQPSPSGLPGQADGRLAQLVLAIAVFDPVGLVDDVDQMSGLGDAPEHLDQTGLDSQLVADKAVKAFAQIGMAARIIDGVDSCPWNQDELVSAIGAAPAKIALQDDGCLNTVLLAGEGRIVGENARFGADRAARIPALGQGGGSAEDHGRQDEQRHDQGFQGTHQGPHDWPRRKQAAAAARPGEMCNRGGRQPGLRRAGADAGLPRG